MIALLVALGGAALALNFPFGSDQEGPFKGQPLPELFPDSRLGLVEKLVAPAQARARRDVERYLATNPVRDDRAFAAFALRAAKESVDHGVEVDLETGLEIERVQFAALFATEDRSTGMQSFMASGPGKAEFQGR